MFAINIALALIVAYFSVSCMIIAKSDLEGESDANIIRGVSQGLGFILMLVAFALLVGALTQMKGIL